MLGRLEFDQILVSVYSMVNRFIGVETDLVIFFFLSHGLWASFSLQDTAIFYVYLYNFHFDCKCFYPFFNNDCFG